MVLPVLNKHQAGKAASGVYFFCQTLLLLKAPVSGAFFLFLNQVLLTPARHPLMPIAKEQLIATPCEKPGSIQLFAATINNNR